MGQIIDLNFVQNLFNKEFSKFLSKVDSKPEQSYVGQLAGKEHPLIALIKLKASNATTLSQIIGAILSIREFLGHSEKCVVNAAANALVKLITAAAELLPNETDKNKASRFARILLETINIIKSLVNGNVSLATGGSEELSIAEGKIKEIEKNLKNDENPEPVNQDRFISHFDTKRLKEVHRNLRGGISQDEFVGAVKQIKRNLQG